MSTLGWNTVIINPVLVAILLYLLYQVYSNHYTYRTLFSLAFFLAISLHLLYLAAMMVIPAIVVMLVHFITRIRQHADLKLRELAIFGAFFLICLSPIVPKLIWYPSESIARHSAFFQQGVEYSQEAKSPLSYYVEQIGLLYQDYTRGKDNFGVEGLWGITLDPIIQVLSILGIILAIVLVIQKRSDSFWIIVFIGWIFLLLVPLVFVYRTTSVWRSYGVLPIVYLLATYALVQIVKLLTFLTQKYLFSTKGLFKFFLSIAFFLYLIFSLPWFSQFLKTYLTKVNGYETRICQYAKDQIDNRVQTGSTIFMPEELCFPLITSLYQDDQYQFVPIRSEEPLPNVTPGTFLVILNSNMYTGYFREDLQKLAEQIASQHDKELLSPATNGQPLLYFIR